MENTWAIALSDMHNFALQFPIHLLKRDVLIFCPFLESNKFFYIEKGFIRVYRVINQEQDLTVSILGEGMFFPLNKIIEEWGNRFFYTSIGECILREIPIETFKKFLSNNDLLKKLLSSNVLSILNQTSANLEICVYCSALFKVASALRLLSNTVGEIKDDTVIFKGKITHELISSIAGISRETATRKLDYLAKQKIIQLHYNHITITNYRALLKLLESSASSK